MARRRRTAQGRESTARVWAAVTRRPCASLEELAAEVGLAESNVRRHLLILRSLGYIEFEDKTVQARNVVIGFGYTRKRSAS